MGLNLNWLLSYDTNCNLRYIQEQCYRFSRGCKPRENFWNCSRKYTKMFKTDSFLGNKKSSLNQNVWRDHATMQQDVLLHFWVIFFIKIRLKYEKIILLSSSKAFSLSTPTFLFSIPVEQWGCMEKSYKMQNVSFLASISGSKLGQVKSNRLKSLYVTDLTYLEQQSD